MIYTMGKWLKINPLLVHFTGDVRVWVFWIEPEHNVTIVALTSDLMASSLCALITGGEAPEFHPCTLWCHQLRGALPETLSKHPASLRLALALISSTSWAKPCCRVPMCLTYNLPVWLWLSCAFFCLFVHVPFQLRWLQASDRVSCTHPKWWSCEPSRHFQGAAVTVPSAEPADLCQFAVNVSPRHAFSNKPSRSRRSSMFFFSCFDVLCELFPPNPCGTFISALAVFLICTFATLQTLPAPKNHHTSCLKALNESAWGMLTSSGQTRHKKLTTFLWSPTCVMSMWSISRRAGGGGDLPE